MSDKTLTWIVIGAVLLLMLYGMSRKSESLPSSYYDGAPIDGIEATLGF